MTLEEAKRFTKAFSEKYFRPIPFKIRQVFELNNELLFDCCLEGEYVLFRESEISAFIE